MCATLPHHSVADLTFYGLYTSIRKPKRVVIDSKRDFRASLKMKGRGSKGEGERATGFAAMQTLT